MIAEIPLQGELTAVLAVTWSVASAAFPASTTEASHLLLQITASTIVARLVPTERIRIDTHVVSAAAHQDLVRATTILGAACEGDVAIRSAYATLRVARLVVIRVACTARKPIASTNVDTNRTR